MRILQVSDFYPPDPGGLEGHVARLAGQLAARGHEVAVATGGAAGTRMSTMDGPVLVGRLPLSLDRLPIYATGRAFHPPWPDPAFVRTLLAMARRFQPDVIHAHGWSEFSAAAVGRRLDVPVVATLHDYGLRCPTKSLHCGDRPCRSPLGLCCLTCRNCDQGLVKRAGLAAAIGLGRGRLAGRIARFLAVSSYLARSHISLGIGDESAYRVMPNFIDDVAMTNSADGPPPADGPILFVGPATPHKGRAVLADAYRSLPVRPPLWLVGGESSASLDGIEYLGRRTGAELADAYRAASVVVVPSVWPDPCPTVALEAMAAGRPVIASAVGGLTDIVEPGVTGLLVPPGDPGALADALRALTEDPELAGKLGAAGRDRVVERFSAAAVVPSIESTYREVGS